MEGTINSNIHPGAKNDLVDLVGELDEPVQEKPAPKKRAAKK